MAGGGFSILCLLCLYFINHVSARNCDLVKNIMSCDECIRCGASWCTEPYWGDPNCVKNPTTDWCPTNQERINKIQPRIVQGNHFSPRFKVSTANIEIPIITEHKYYSGVKKVKSFEITNTSQSLDITRDINNVCNKTTGECTLTVESTVGKEFCNDNGTPEEYISLKVQFDDVEEDVDIKYHVPCACACSQKVEVDSKFCNFHGNYTCGACSCRSGWEGKKCEKNIKKRCHNRGDNDDVCADDPNYCSGNGRCECGECDCDSESPRSRYFDPKNCQDFCTVFNPENKPFCISNSDIKGCINSTQFNLVPLNSSMVFQRDEKDRLMWVNCTLKLDSCDFVYALMKEYSGDVFVMMLETCVTVPAGIVSGGSINVVLPVVLSLLALAVLGGVLTTIAVLNNRKPPLLTSDQYKNICAEEVLGENPLYKPPTTSFKNPTYGKLEK